MVDILSQLLIALTTLSSLLSPNLGAISDCKADVTRSVSERIKDCPISGKDKANFKAQEIVKHNLKGTFTKDDLTIEITDYRTMDGGIEVFARAWKNGKQLGFGKDGTVDIERFRIFNPPVMVKDGTFRKEVVPFGSTTREIDRTNYKEDLVEATHQTLVRIISQVGKNGSNIVSGKIGNTTSTFYSDTGGDGTVRNCNANWTTARDAATGDYSENALTDDWVWLGDFEATYCIAVGFLPFDTSALPDTDTISSATLTVTQANNAGEGDRSASIIQSTQASNTLISTADYDQRGGLSSISEGTDTRQTLNSANTAFNFTLNATGIGWISKTGYSKFGLRGAKDIDNSTPTARNYTRINYADQTGTASDPTLVVVHAAAAVEVKKQDIIWFIED